MTLCFCFVLFFFKFSEGNQQSCNCESALGVVVRERYQLFATSFMYNVYNSLVGKHNVCVLLITVLPLITLQNEMGGLRINSCLAPSALSTAINYIVTVSYSYSGRLQN